MKNRVIIFLLLLLIVVSTGCAASNAINDKEASDVLRITAATAVAYAAMHNGKYDGMDAASMGKLGSNLMWVDGEPGPGQLAVENASGDNYTIAYKNTRGQVYRVVRKNNSTTYESPQNTTAQ